MEHLSNNLGHFAYPVTGIVTVIAIMVYFVLTINVGRARARYHVAPPTVDGPPEFQRRFRVHMNTLEQIVVFIPLLWLCAFAVGDVAAAIPGTLWPVGRILYAEAYYREPEKRYLGFGITVTASMLLLIEALVGIVASL